MKKEMIMRFLPLLLVLIITPVTWAKESNKEVYATLQAYIKNNENAKFIETFKAQKLDADFVPEDEFSLPLIFTATTQGNVEIVTFLLSQGSDVNQLSKYGTVMHFALEKQHLDVAWVLLENGFDPRVELQRKEYRIALNLAAYWQKDEGRTFYKAMIEKGMDVDLISSRKGISVIHLAAYQGDLEMLSLLHECGADMNNRTRPSQLTYKAPEEYTPLMLARYAGQEEAFNLLLSFDEVNKELTGKDGKTVYEIETEKEVKAREEALREAERKRPPEFVPIEVLESYSYDNANETLQSYHKGIAVSRIHNVPKGFNQYSADMDVQGDNIVIVGATGLNVRISTDGGQSYTYHRLSRFADAMVGVQYKDDGTIYMVAGSGKIYRTKDHGKSFEAYDTAKLVGHSYQRYTKIKFFNEKIGVVLGEDGVLLRTEDGGDHWKRVPVETKATLSDIDIVSEDFLALSTLDADVLFSYDAGKSWGDKVNLKSISHQYADIRAVDFVNKKVGYAGGKYGFYKTVDGGKHFSKIDFIHTYAYGRSERISEDGIVGQIAFIDEKRGFVATNGDYALYRTLDGGETFNAEFDLMGGFSETSKRVKIIDGGIYLLGRDQLVRMDVDTRQHQQALTKQSRVYFDKMELLRENILPDRRELTIKVPMRYLDEVFNLVEITDPPKWLTEQYRYQYFNCEEYECTEYEKQTYVDVTEVDKNILSITIDREDENESVRIFRVNKDTNRTEFTEFSLKKRLLVRVVKGDTSVYTDGEKEYAVILNEKYRHLRNREYEDIEVVVKRFDKEGELLHSRKVGIDENGSLSLKIDDVEKEGQMTLEVRPTYAKDKAITKNVELKRFEAYNEIHNVHLKIPVYGKARLGAEINVEDNTKVVGRLYLFDENDKKLATMEEEGRVKDKQIMIEFDVKKLLDESDDIFDKTSYYSGEIES